MTQPFEQLVARHQGVVCAVAYAVLRDRARSEEIAQEAFLIAWQKLPALAEPPRLPGWICGIARNLAANAARRRKETAMESEPATDTSPLDEVLTREADAIARAALARLPERDREVVVMYYRGDGTLEEVAAALGVTAAAVRKRLERARTRLREAVAAVEATLRSTRPGPAFTAGCVAALATGAALPRAHATPGVARYAIPAASIGALGVLLAVGVGGHGTSTPAKRESHAPSAAAPAERTHDAAAQAAMVRPIDRTTHASLAQRIEAARTARAATAAAPTSSSGAPAASEPATKIYDFAGSVLDDAAPLAPPADPHLLSKSTLRYAIRQIQPLLLECYKASADRLPRKNGTIEVTLHLVTDPDVATIVDSASLGGDAQLLEDAGMVECMHETLMSIELPAMSEAATVDVIYPFVIR